MGEDSFIECARYGIIGVIIWVLLYLITKLYFKRKPNMASDKQRALDALKKIRQNSQPGLLTDSFNLIHKVLNGEKLPVEQFDIYVWANDQWCLSEDYREQTYPALHESLTITLPGNMPINEVSERVIAAAKTLKKLNEAAEQTCSVTGQRCEWEVADLYLEQTDIPDDMKRRVEGVTWTNKCITREVCRNCLDQVFVETDNLKGTRRVTREKPDHWPHIS